MPFSAAPPYGALEVFDPRLTLPQTTHWSVTLEQSLGTEQTLWIGYAGAAGRGLLRREAWREFNPDFGAPLYVTRNAATSDYQALQIQLQRRLARAGRLHLVARH